MAQTCAKTGADLARGRGGASDYKSGVAVILGWFCVQHHSLEVRLVLMDEEPVEIAEADGPGSLIPFCYPSTLHLVVPQCAILRPVLKLISRQSRAGSLTKHAFCSVCQAFLRDTGKV